MKGLIATNVEATSDTLGLVRRLDEKKISLKSFGDFSIETGNTVFLVMAKNKNTRYDNYELFGALALESLAQDLLGMMLMTKNLKDGRIIHISGGEVSSIKDYAFEDESETEEEVA